MPVFCRAVEEGVWKLGGGGGSLAVSAGGTAVRQLQTICSRRTLRVRAQLLPCGALESRGGDGRAGEEPFCTLFLSPGSPRVLALFWGQF